MPKNTLLFPPSFVFDTIGAESGISGLQIAVNNLAIASKSGAMRQAHALGVGGRNSIKNQNKGMPTLNSLLPTRSVGKYTVAPAEAVGTVGYLLGGYSLTFGVEGVTIIDRLSLITNTVANLGGFIFLRYCFTFANKSFGYFGFLSDVYRLTFQSESFSRLGATLFPPRLAGASLRIPSRGYACSGTNNEGGGQAFTNVDRFSFAGEVSASIGATVIARTQAIGFGNKFNGYLVGGIANGIGQIPLTTIERFSYANEIASVISTTLSAGGKYGGGGWSPGSPLASYLMGMFAYGRFPDPVNSPPRGYRTKLIDKFTYTGETLAVLGTLMAYGNGVFAGVGNTTRTFIAGGYRHGDAYEVQASSQQVQTADIIALTFATETVATVGALSRSRYSLSAVDNS